MVPSKEGRKISGRPRSKANEFYQQRNETRGSIKSSSSN